MNTTHREIGKMTKLTKKIAQKIQNLILIAIKLFFFFFNSLGFKVKKKKDAQRS